MKEIYKYKILYNIGLVIEYHGNELTVNDIKNLRQDVINDKNFKPGFGILIDIRKSDINASKIELHEYSKWISELVEHGILNRRAVLTNTPQQVVQSVLFSYENSNISDSLYMTFSTIEASLNWLNIKSSDFDHVKKEIKNLVK